MAELPAVDIQRLCEEELEEAFTDFVVEPVLVAAERKQLQWRGRALAAGLAVAGVLGCANGGSRWAAAQPLQSRITDGELAVQEKFTLLGEEPAFVTWKLHPNKCWSVPDEMKNAMKVHMMDCPDKPDKFIIPAGGIGKIRSAKYPEFCLDAPRGSAVVQFFECDKGPEENMQWAVPKDREGPIKPANDEDRCLDVPGGKTEDGTPLQQWECSTRAESNEGFVIHWPADCNWKEWSEWTECSSKCRGHLTRERVSHPDGGKECHGHETERRECGSQDCESSDDDSSDEDSSDEEGKTAKDGCRGACEVSRALVFGLCLLFLSGRS